MIFAGIALKLDSGISAYFEIPTCENYKPFAGISINKYQHDLYMIFGINTTRDISKLSQISLA